MADLDCRTVSDHVSGFLDEDLDTDMERRIVTHLAGCVGCHRYVDQVRWTVRLLGAISARAAPGPR